MASNNFYAGYQYGAASYSGYVAPDMTPSVYPGQIPQSYPTTSRNPPEYDQSYVANQIQATYAYPSRSQQTAYTNDTIQYPTQTASTAYPYTSNETTYTNTYNSVVSNYAASALYNQHQQASFPVQTESNNAVYSSNKQSNWNFKKNQKSKSKASQQIHYCDVCKISCAGPQTYKEHLDGQRHKKKEAQAKTANPNVIAMPSKRNHANAALIRCELCEIVCTGNEAYAAHVRGSKHQKVLKLHTKLGKPIPADNPLGNLQITSSSTANLENLVVPSTNQSKIKVLGTPKINFVVGGRLHTTKSAGMVETDASMETSQSEQQQVPPNGSTDTTETVSAGAASSTPTVGGANESLNNSSGEKDCQPVGQDYIDETRSDDNKSVSYHCKLCDCKFNDPSAKEMHLKGRRHRLQYKKKVDPNLMVDIKSSKNVKKFTETKNDRKHGHRQRMDHYWNDWYNPQHAPPPPNHPNSMYGYDSPAMPYAHPSMPFHNQPFNPNYALCRNDAPPMIGNAVTSMYRRGNVISWDDNHIMQKHSEIVPKEDELDDIFHVVQITERALKLVSDKLAEQDAQMHASEVLRKELQQLNAAVEDSLNQKDKETESSEAKENTEDETKSENVAMTEVTAASNEQVPIANPVSEKEANEKPDDTQTFRVLKGLVRTGPLAENLLLTGEKSVSLVVICAEKPTKHLLQRVVDCLPKQLEESSQVDKFTVVMKLQDAGFTVSSINEPQINVNVVLTSPLVRETNIPEGAPAEMVKEPKQMLDKQKCLDALAALRHAKWYQARLANRQPGSTVIRIIRDLCRRLPTWSRLSLWSVKLLCERVIDSAGEPLTPGEAFRHILEAIASGLLLPSGCGLFDPCEKEPTDALSILTRQEREDITSSAQHALRLIAFRQIYKILGVEPISTNKKRKRLSENDREESTDNNLAALKKLKKDEENFMEDESADAASNNFADANIEQIFFEKIDG